MGANLECWVNLLRCYSLEKVLGEFKKNLKVEVDGHEYLRTNYTVGILLDQNRINLIRQERENRHLFYTALDYQMTITQYLRFRSLIDCAREAGLSTNIEEIAQEVIEFDKF